LSECFWLQKGRCRLMEAEAREGFCNGCRSRISVEQAEQVLDFINRVIRLHREVKLVE